MPSYSYNLYPETDSVEIHADFNYYRVDKARVYMNVCGWTSYKCSKLPWSMFNVSDIDYFSGRYVNMIKSLS